MFLQGNGFPVQCYGPALRPLLDRATVHGINLRGQGNSPYPAPILNWYGHLDDLKTYLSRNFNPPYLLAGHSMGAVLAMKLACELPQAVSGLLLLEPPIPFVRNHPNLDKIAVHLEGMAARATARMARWNSREEAGAYLRDRGLYKDWVEGCMDLFMAHGIHPGGDVVDGDAANGGAVELASTPSAEADAYLGHPGAGIFDLPEKIQTPVVMLRGENSDISRDAMVELSGMFSVSVLYTIAGKHTFPMENPAETGKVLSSALNMLLNKPGPFAG